MARARDVGELDCEEAFALAAAQVIEVRADEVLTHSAGVLDLGEIERVHDMRVATRRLQAALAVFGKCFPRERRRVATKQVKALADALGERRDPDVSIETVERLADQAGIADRRGVDAPDRALQARAGGGERAAGAVRDRSASAGPASRPRGADA